MYSGYWRQLSDWTELGCLSLTIVTYEYSVVFTSHPIVLHADIPSYIVHVTI